MVVAESVTDPEDPRSFVRTYPEGEAFAHIVGYNSFIVGDSGLEKAYARWLRSRRDLTISDLISVILGRDLRPHSVEMTVDGPLQHAAFEASRGQTRARWSPSTQDWRHARRRLVSVVRPRIAARRRRRRGVGRPARRSRQAAQRPGDREIFAPGSTFKTVVTATALDTGAAGPGPSSRTPWSSNCQGQRRPSPTSTAMSATTEFGDHAHGLRSVLQHGLRRPVDAPRRRGHRDHRRSVGFNTELDIPLDGARGHLPVDELAARPCSPRPRAGSGNATSGRRRCIWRWSPRRSPIREWSSPLIW